MPRKKTNKQNNGKRKKNSTKSTFSIKKFVFKAILVGAMWACLGIAILIGYYAKDIPDVSKINENIRQPSIVLYDRDKQVIATIGDLYGEYVKYNEFPKTLVDAVTSTEDRRFFKHSGIDVQGMLRAVFVNSFAGHVVQGGSTITQQLAKIVYLSHERTFKRKIQEFALAIYLENHFTKEQILTMYLNRIYTGNGNYGMEAASQSYFGKHVSEINLTESAILAGLIKAPSRYSPANNPDLALERAYQVLLNMVDNGTIQATSLPADKKITYNFQAGKMHIQNQAPYFSDWIREQLPDYIGQYTSGNIEVYTTLDSNLQHIADSALIRSIGAHSKESNVHQGAMLVMSPGGDILAMVGGKSYAESQFNRATQALRQPGSSFKLFVYLAALENGYTPESTMDDSPISIKGWAPENHDNKYIGEVTLTYAFAKSLNTVAVRLAKAVGMTKIANLAYQLGITSEVKRDLSSALGTSEVTLMELTGAYAHLANYGNAVWVHGINSINVDGEQVYKREKTEDERVLDAGVTAQMNKMLKEVVRSGTGHNAQLPFDTAGKTGTTQDLRDAWFVGFTSDYVAGVWMGNDDNTSMDKIAGGSLPAMVWKDFMKEAEGGKYPAPIAVSGSDVSEGHVSESKGIWNGIIKVFGGDEQ